MATLNEVIFESEESFLLDQSTLLILNYESISYHFEKLKNTRLNNTNRLAISQLNITSLCSTNDSLVHMLHNNVDLK